MLQLNRDVSTWDVPVLAAFSQWLNTSGLQSLLFWTWTDGGDTGGIVSQDVSNPNGDWHTVRTCAALCCSPGSFMLEDCSAGRK
jgi:hypothetical protein